MCLLNIPIPPEGTVAEGETEVQLNNLDQPSVVAASLIQTLSCKDRKAKLTTEANLRIMDEIKKILIQQCLKNGSIQVSVEEY
jgi:mRNA interferase MazF